MQKTKFNVSKKTTIDDAFDMFLLNCKQKDLTEKTITNYHYVYYRFVKVMEIDSLDEFTSKTINKFILNQLERGLKKATVNNYLRHMRTILYYLYDEGELDNKVKIKLLKEEIEVKHIFSEDDLNKMLLKPDLKICTFVEYRDWLICNLLINTGIRVGSMVNILVKDIDFANNLLLIRHTKGKRQQILPFSVELSKIIKSYISKTELADDDFLICNFEGKKINCTSIYHSLEKYNKKRGVKLKGLHIFRRTFITNAINKGIDSVRIANMVGHRDVNMIKKHYYNVNTESLRDVMEMMYISPTTNKKKRKTIKRK